MAGLQILTELISAGFIIINRDRQVRVEEDMGIPRETLKQDDPQFWTQNLHNHKEGKVSFVKMTMTIIPFFKCQMRSKDS